jgi:hypothetical protein
VTGLLRAVVVAVADVAGLLFQLLAGTVDLLADR